MKKVGIVTFNDAYNYGAFLQEYALFKFLKQHNINPVVINYENGAFSQLYLYSNNLIKRKGLKNKFKILYNMLFRFNSTYKKRLKKNKKFMECIHDEITLSSKYDSNSFNEDDYDCFISGSDQVWNVRMTGYNYFYFLDFVKNNNKKLSYAASFGRTEFDNNDFEIFKHKLENFKKLLVREESGKKMLKEKCNLESYVVLDPTFMISKNDWHEFGNKSNIAMPPKKYIVIYIVSEPTFLYKKAIKYAEENDYEIVLLGRNSGINVDGRYIEASIDVGPYDFIKYLINAEAVFCTSFHGIILSLNNNKDFFYELSTAKINNNARLIDVLKLFKIEGRNITEKDFDETKINWEAVNKRIELLRKDSGQLLLDAIGEGDLNDK